MAELDFIKKAEEKIKETKPLENLTRRGFLKVASLLTVGGVVFGAEEAIAGKVNFGKEVRRNKKIENSWAQEVEDNFWLSIIESVSRQTGEQITPNEIRGYIITKLFNIPQGQTSGLATKKESLEYGGIGQERVYPELDKLLATHFTNRAILRERFRKGGPVISTDFRDFPNIRNTLKLFKQQVDELDVSAGRELGLNIYSILKDEYIHLQKIYRKNSASRDGIKEVSRDRSVEFSYLPGGVPVFLRGYSHKKDWQRVHGEHLANTYKNTRYVILEGITRKGFGKSLPAFWADPTSQYGSYDRLMKDLIKNEFKGLFVEMDGRDKTKINFDSYFDKNNNVHQVKLPNIFYEQYFKYLQTEDKVFTEKLGSWEKLKRFMLAQTTFKARVINSDAKIYNKGKEYDASLSITDNLSVSTIPTGNELGQKMFADALAALKLHIMAQSMNEGKIEKGIIVDFEGANHSAMKSFYLKYPQYAAEIVLRTVYELMVGYVDSELSEKEYRSGKNNAENLNQVLELLRSPDWNKIVHGIGRIAMNRIEDNPNKTEELGQNQKAIKQDNRLNTNILENITPETIIALFDDKYIQAQIDKTKMHNTIN